MTVIILRDISDDYLFPIVLNSQKEVTDALAQFAKTHWYALGIDEQAPHRADQVITRFFGADGSSYEYTIFSNVDRGSTGIPFSDSLKGEDTISREANSVDGWDSALPFASFNDPDCDCGIQMEAHYHYSEEEKWNDHSRDAIAVIRFLADVNSGHVDTSKVQYSKVVSDMKRLQFDLNHATKHLQNGIASKLFEGAFHLSTDDDATASYDDDPLGTE